MGATRTAAVIVPEWPLLAARDRLERAGADGTGTEGEGPDLEGANPEGADAEGADPVGAMPLILLDRHRVLHADPAAQAAGVAPGMRRRSAQAACPQARVVETDRDHEQALFELVAAAVDTVAAGVDVLRPGIVLMSAGGAARHAGGEEALAESVVDAVAELTGWDCSVGVADGPFAALLAARAGRLVHPGRSAEYLAPHPIAALRHAPVGPGWGHRGQVLPAVREKRRDLAETVDLLTRLGITTLGDFAALPPAAVVDRFGADVALLHLLSRGEEAAPPAMHHPAQPLDVVRVLESPLVRTDQAAFVARPMAEELHELLVGRGLICTRLRISARTENGEEMERTWRHDGELTVADVVDRIRWQCDGWITRSRLGTARTGAIVRLGLHPLQLTAAGEGAAALWGSAGEASQRASRAFARAQGVAGEDAVMVPAVTGGRLLAEQVTLIPWRTERPVARPGPWPGSLPRPVPTTVFREHPAVQLLDREGQHVVVTARGLLSGPPVRLRVAAQGGGALAGRPALAPGQELSIQSYGAPTVLDERWWGADGHRAARLQMLLRHPASGTGGVEAPGMEPELLAVVALSREGSWMLEGIYD